MLELYLWDSDSGEQVSSAFEALLFDSNSDILVADTCSADEDAKDDMEVGKIADICPGDSISNVSRSSDHFKLSFSFALEPRIKFKFDNETTLESFISSYGVLTFKKQWCTANMSPCNMSEALVANLHNIVKWRCIVWWVCILTYYQKHVVARIAALKDAEQQAIVDKKEGEIEEKKAIGAEKKLLAEEKTAEHVVAAAVAMLGDIVQKLQCAKETCAASRAAVKKANTEARKQMAKTVTLNHKKRVLRLLTKKSSTETEVERTAEAAEKINTSLAQIRKRSSRDEEAEEGCGLLSDITVTMWGEEAPYFLQDYWSTRVMLAQKSNTTSPFAAENVPTCDQITVQWKKVCACIMNCADKRHALLVEEGLWNECYDRLFCYEARKKLVEKDLFFQKDISGYVKIVENNIKTPKYSYSHCDRMQQPFFLGA